MIARQFFESYLFAYVFWLQLALGSLALLMMHHLTGGAWGMVLRRFLEAATRTFWVLALLFVPLLFGLGKLYAWADPRAVSADMKLQHKAIYLNIPFFVGRAALYFAVWIVLSRVLDRRSRVWESSGGDPLAHASVRSLCGGGLVAWGLSITFAAIDWVMSLEAHWYSTIYGMVYMADEALSALSFALICTLVTGKRLARRGDLPIELSGKAFIDAGNVLLAATLVWAYLSFMQFLIIWSANIPEETTWFLHRARGGWQWLALGLFLFQFAGPFFFLLVRDSKRRLDTLVVIASVIFGARMAETYWLIAPAFHQQRWSIHWLDFLCLIVLGAIWLAAYAWQLRIRPAFAVETPQWEEAMKHA